MPGGSKSNNEHAFYGRQFVASSLTASVTTVASEKILLPGVWRFSSRFQPVFIKQGAPGVAVDTSVGAHIPKDTPEHLVVTRVGVDDAIALITSTLTASVSFQKM